MKFYTFISFMLVSTVFLSSCQDEQVRETVKPSLKIPSVELAAQPPLTTVQTTTPSIALTFNGLANDQTMTALLDALERAKITATFFVPGMQAAENPELIETILDYGHSVQNNTLNLVAPDALSYEEAYREIFLADQVLRERFALEPKYVRSKSGDSTEPFELAAAQLKQRVVTSTINPKDRMMQSAEEMLAYIDRFVSRGAIIELNTYLNPEIIPLIDLLAERMGERGYAFTSLEKLEATSYVTENSVATNGLELQSSDADVQPKVIRQFKTDEREVSLTFDDWAGEEQTLQLLDLLDRYDVKATFFLITKGVERNPQLARLILERGHEVASHSYNHQVVTEMTADALQQDVVRSDKILTTALQQKPLNYFRPAQGIMNDEAARNITATGVDYIMLYDIASWDWNMEIEPEEVYDRIMTAVEPGSIITMHLLDESHTLDVLPNVIETLQRDGYAIQPISAMLEKEGAVQDSERDE